MLLPFDGRSSCEDKYTNMSLFENCPRMHDLLRGTPVQRQQRWARGLAREVTPPCTEAETAWNTGSGGRVGGGWRGWCFVEANEEGHVGDRSSRVAYWRSHSIPTMCKSAPVPILLDDDSLTNELSAADNLFFGAGEIRSPNWQDRVAHVGDCVALVWISKPESCSYHCTFAVNLNLGRVCFSRETCASGSLMSVVHVTSGDLRRVVFHCSFAFTSYGVSLSVKRVCDDFSRCVFVWTCDACFSESCVDVLNVKTA